MSEQVTIYALCDPDGSVRYIGQTIQHPEVRLVGHMTEKENRLKADWLTDLKAGGLMPLIKVLDVVDTAAAKDAEISHITRHIQMGCNLVNTMHTPRLSMLLKAAHARRTRRLNLAWARTVTLPPEWGEEIEQLAAKRGMAVSATLRSLIRQALDARRPKQEHDERGEQP